MFVPILNNVLISPIEAEETTKGGIIIPKGNDVPVAGKVMAVGQELENQPMEVKEGDTVLFKQFVGTPISLNGENYLMMPQDAIWGYDRES